MTSKKPRTIDKLQSSFGFAKAQRLIVSGGSAGGLSTFLNVDHIADRLRAAQAEERNAAEAAAAASATVALLPPAPGARVVGRPVAGFFIEGGDPGRVLIRGIGPTLAEFNLTGVLEDPILKLYRGANEITANDDWASQMNSDAVRSYWQGAGAFDLAGPSKDGARYQVLSEGLYTAQVRGVGGTTGIGLVEVYDVGDADSGLLTNISTRGRIGGGGDIMIMGFVREKKL